MNFLQSRTVWTVLVMLALTTLQTAHDIMPPALYLLCYSVLSALAVYFRVNPRV